MPLERGALYAFHGPSVAGSTAVVVLTASTWNMRMSSFGVAMVRPRPSALEAPHSVALGQDGSAVASAVASLNAPPHPESGIGALIRALAASELAQLEDRLCSFLLLPQLIAGSVFRPALPGDPAAYPVWGDVYTAEPPFEGERKRYVVVSPNAWNAASPYVSVVRTTSQEKVAHVSFPLILDDKTRAACGDLDVRNRGQVLLARRDRPTPSTTRFKDMGAIARGIAVTFRLGHALERAGVTPPEGSTYS